MRSGVPLLPTAPPSQKRAQHRAPCGSSGTSKVFPVLGAARFCGGSPASCATRRLLSRCQLPSCIHSWPWHFVGWRWVLQESGPGGCVHGEQLGMTNPGNNNALGMQRNGACEGSKTLRAMRQKVPPRTWHERAPNTRMVGGGGGGC
jgi:hypothetical protein